MNGKPLLLNIIYAIMPDNKTSDIKSFIASSFKYKLKLEYSFKIFYISHTPIFKNQSKKIKLNIQ